MIYVLFIAIVFSRGATSFQRDFKTKNECEMVLKAIQKNYIWASGFCQEVKK